jgi:hypothetical protein
MISPYNHQGGFIMSSDKRTPDQESPETTTAVAEPPATEAKPEGQSFADRVGQKQRVVTADPFGIISDPIAGVRLFESKRDGQMAIQFGEGRPEEKPSQAVIDKMKEAGYRWNPSDRIWAHPVRPDSAKSVRIEADRLYKEVRQMIRQEKGIEPAREVPF